MGKKDKAFKPNQDQVIPFHSNLSLFLVIKKIMKHHRTSQPGMQAQVLQRKQLFVWIEKQQGNKRAGTDLGSPVAC
jgi:hypothetical protein